MRKSLKITLNVLVAILALMGCVIFNGTCLKANKIKSDNSIWMSKVDGETLLKDIVIPGSHDSGTYTMPYVGKTQYLDINNQLKLGIRYFDLRANMVKGNCLIYHGPVNGTKLDPILQDFKDFIIANPSETIILDFQHFKNGADDYVFDKISSLYKNYYLVNDSGAEDNEFIDSLKLEKCRGKIVVFFGYRSHVESNFIFERSESSSSCLTSYYEEENHYLSSINFIENIPNEYANKFIDNKQKGLFVLQTQLTDKSGVLGPYHKYKIHRYNLNTYLANIPNVPYFESLNIIMLDFANEETVNIILSLYKNVTIV